MSNACSRNGGTGDWSNWWCAVPARCVAWCCCMRWRTIWSARSDYATRPAWLPPERKDLRVPGTQCQGNPPIQPHWAAPRATAPCSTHRTRRAQQPTAANNQTPVQQKITASEPAPAPCPPAPNRARHAEPAAQSQRRIPSLAVVQTSSQRSAPARIGTRSGSASRSVALH
jgi:hypothetical protein